MAVVRRKWLRWYVFTGAFIVVLLAAAASYSFAYAKRIPPHTTIAGVAVGGLTYDQANHVLADANTSFANQKITLHYQDKQWQVKPSDLGTSVDFTSSLNQIWKQDKQGTWKHAGKQLFVSLVNARTFDANLVPLSEAGKEYFETTVLKNIEVAYQETTLSFAPGDVTVVPGKAGQRLDENQFEVKLYSALKNHTTDLDLVLAPFQPEITSGQAATAQQEALALLASPWTSPSGFNPPLTIQPTDFAGLLTTDVTHDPSGVATGLELTLKINETRKVLDTWAAQTNKKPVNAKLKFDNGSVAVAQEGTSGTSLNVDQSFTNLRTSIEQNTPDSKHQLPLSFSSVLPEVRSDTLTSLGLVDQIGTATTDFSGSPTNRVFNITKGESSLSGALLANDAVFSTVGTLGPIEESTGYLPELVILGNRTVPEAGGGLCQVSTTLFRSVLNAGLPIVERTNHAYRVSYYERGVGPGLDATIYDPSPDFKWKNDTGHMVYVQAFVQGTKLTFELYGTKDGRVSNITKPTILETYPVGAPIYSNTDTLDVGTTKQVETAHDGAKTTVTYTVNRNGQQINQQTFVSVYQAWPAQFLVGTRQPANPTPTP